MLFSLFSSGTKDGYICPFHTHTPTQTHTHRYVIYDRIYVCLYYNNNYCVIFMYLRLFPTKLRLKLCSGQFFGYLAKLDVSQMEIDEPDTKMHTIEDKLYE